MGGCCAKNKQSDQLSPREIDLLVMTWTKLLDQEGESGCFIFESFFSLYPEEKAKFAYETNSPVLSVLNTSRMQSHCKKVLDSLNSVVVLLLTGDNKERDVQTLYEIGYWHQKQDVHCEDMSKLGNALLNAVRKGLGMEFNSEIEAAWMKLIGLVGLIFNSGLTQAEKDLGARRSIEFPG